MLMRAIAASFRQLAEPATLRLLVYVTLMSLVIFAGVGVLGWQALLRWGVPSFGGWVHASDSALLAALFTVLGIWFGFRAVAMAVMGLFTDRIVESVEAAHYPAANARAVPVPFARGMAMGLRAALRALGWNLVALPVYLGLLITGVGTVILALLLNGYLLGPELEAMVAARHPGAAPLARPVRWALGLATSALFLLPFVNLLAPLFGASLAVHLFHAPRKAKP